MKTKIQFTEPVEPVAYMGHLIKKHYYDSSWLMADWTGEFSKFSGEGEYVGEMSHDLDSIKSAICQRVIDDYDDWKSTELLPLLDRMVGGYQFSGGGILCEMQSGMKYEINKDDFYDWLNANHLPAIEGQTHKALIEEPEYFVEAMTAQVVERYYWLRLEEFIEAGEPGVWERVPGDREGAQWFERAQEAKAPQPEQKPEPTPLYYGDRDNIYH